MTGLARWFVESLFGRYLMLGLAVLAGLAFKRLQDERRGAVVAREAMQKEDRDVAKAIRTDVQRSRSGSLRPETIIYRD
jgi:hypothetical protein